MEHQNCETEVKAEVLKIAVDREGTLTGKVRLTEICPACQTVIGESAIRFEYDTPALLTFADNHLNRVQFEAEVTEIEGWFIGGKFGAEITARVTCSCHDKSVEVTLTLP